MKHLTFIILLLGGCSIKTPELPEINRESFSYDQILEQQNKLQQEVQLNS